MSIEQKRGCGMALELKIKYAILRGKLKRKASLYRAKLMDLPYMLTQKETRG